MQKHIPGLSLHLALGLLLTGCISPRVSTPTATSEPATPPPPATPTFIPRSEFKISLELVAEGFTAPLALVFPPDGSGRAFIVDQVGVMWILAPQTGLLSLPFLDIQPLLVELEKDEVDERGLLGLAFHPNFQDNGRFFVYYSAPLRPGGTPGYDHTNHLSEFRVSAQDPNQADSNSERIILQLDNYQEQHNGGQLLFGPDGYLYLGVGDGGGPGDPLGNSQNLESLSGKILRIDVDQGDPYAIPPDNPFVGIEGRDEIFAYGLRNPWRFSFDTIDYRLFVGDVGQGVFEEIDLVIKGGNYGWNIKEGSSCFNPQDRGHPLETCPSLGANGEPFIDPVVEYDHRQGSAVIGGFIYRGSALPQLYGHYIFGDWGYVHGKIFVAIPPPSGEGGWSIEILRIARTSLWDLEGRHILSFGQDPKGELYLLTTAKLPPIGHSGQVFRIIAAQ